MVKSEARARAKMENAVRSAGAEVKAGMNDGPDPIDIALKDVAGHSKKMQDGLAESVRTGKFESGLKKAKARNAYRESADRAAAHYEEAAPRMVENSMADYNARAAVIEKAVAEVKKMPKATRAQRIARSQKYQELSAAGFDTLYGRKN